LELITLDRQDETLFYLIKSNNESIKLSKIFSLIENNKHLLNIESYSLSETNLEQIFMSLAKTTPRIQHKIFDGSWCTRWFPLNLLSYLTQAKDFLTKKAYDYKSDSVQNFARSTPEEVFTLSYKKINETEDNNFEYRF
jgi:hypothetical protein